MTAIHIAAQELVDHHADHALDIAKDRVKRLEAVADWPVHSIATQVLTEVEKLVGEAKNSGGKPNR